MTFLLPLIGLIAGILAGDFLHGPIWGAIPVLSALVIYLVILKKSRLPFNAAKLNSRHSIWVTLLFSGIGLLASWVHAPMQLQENELDNYSAIVGEVADVKTGATGDVFTIDVEQLFDRQGRSRDCRKLLVSVKTDGFSAVKGDILFLPVKLNPIKDNENYRSKGYADRLRRKGVFYTSYAKFDDIKIKGHSSSIRNNAAGWRDKIEIALEKSSLQRETSEFIISILLGDRSFLSDDVKESFSNAGVAHVLALSGMHVGIIMGIILFLLYPLKVAGLHKTRYWIALALVWAYAYFTGLAPSTVRACIMTSFLILALSIQRRNVSSNALLASAFVILLFDPSAIYDIGMQLSFLCVACIITFAGPLNTVSRHAHPRLHAINASILVSLVATMGTWVLVSYYFKRIPLLFLPVNMALLPMLPFYLSVALVYTAVCINGIDIPFIARFLDIGYNLFIKIVEHLSAFGSATIEYQATLPVVVLWLLGVLMIGYAMKRKRKAVAITTASVLFIGSIAITPLLSSTQPDGFIFQKRYSNICMALYNADKEKLVSFPRNTISKIDFKGNEIFSIDCMTQLDSIATILKKSGNSKKKYLILGSGFKNCKLSDIPGLEKFNKIIVHPSVRKKREREIVNEAINKGLYQIHSLRNDGPLEIDLPNQ